MTPQHVDVAIIGAGTAGLAAYRAAKSQGVSALLIEGGTHGTTCARVGCMPSKLLIAAAEASHQIDKAPGFGVHVRGSKFIDGAEVMARVRSERDRFVGFVLAGVDKIPTADRIDGRAEFQDDHTLAITHAHGTAKVTFGSAVIATGSRPSYPDHLQVLGDRLIVNDDVFAWNDLPRSVAVIGPGVIGLELGQALHRLGVRVVILGRGGRLGPITDPTLRAYALEAFQREFALDLGAHISHVERTDAGARLTYRSCAGRMVTEEFDYVLAATGRAPNTTRIGLENTQAKLDTQGVPLHDHHTAQIESVGTTGNLFIAGDVSNALPLLHEAADEGKIAGLNAARHAQGMPALPGLRRAELGIVFTDPQIAIVGGGYSALTPGTFATGTVSFEDQGRARVMLRNTGLLQVYGELASGRFLGAEMIGPDAEHLGHLLSWALANKMTVARMLDLPFYHPVVEEGLRTALRDLDANLAAASLGQAA